MITDLGVPLLEWLRATVIREAHQHLDRFDSYLERWEAFLLNRPYENWPLSSTPET